jgi:cytochrome c-type biogenesis protein CcmF
VLTPEKRFYPVQRMPTTEAGIDRGLARDLYIVIGDQQEDGGWVVRSFLKPMANWIWLGAIIMALGGTLSLTDRRFRMAAASRRDSGGPRAVPAE